MDVGIPIGSDIPVPTHCCGCIAPSRNERVTQRFSIRKQIIMPSIAVVVQEREHRFGEIGHPHKIIRIHDHGNVDDVAAVATIIVACQMPLIFDQGNFISCSFSKIEDSTGTGVRHGMLLVHVGRWDQNALCVWVLDRRRSHERCLLLLLRFILVMATQSILLVGATATGIECWCSKRALKYQQQQQKRVNLRGNHCLDGRTALLLWWWCLPSL
mmetsp:Transcript_16921/g.47489  ORF Transcript_16921/g.47489 Transcript_16921/m.47489 type:complete len:214 (-) Transcript_16921:112-753(-)